MLQLQSIEVQTLVNQLRAFENHLQVPAHIVYPAFVREQYPDTAEDLLVFTDQSYYHLPVDERDNVDPELRQFWEETEDALMRFCCDDRMGGGRLYTVPYNFTQLERMGYAVFFDLSSPGAVLLYVRLRDGYFYVNVSSYQQRLRSA